MKYDYLKLHKHTAEVLCFLIQNLRESITMSKYVLLVKTGNHSLMVEVRK